MTGSEVPRLKAWFADYCKSFASTDENDQRNISLKEHHTHNVWENTISIATGESLSPEKRSVAEIIALFHDLGRFEQYRRYKTFKDSDSVNHAALSAEIIKEKDILRSLAVAEQELILKAVRLHNVYLLPPELDADTTFYLKLIRDADKLDIWRVFLEFYALPETERASAVGLGFPDRPEITAEVLAILSNRRMIRLSTLQTLNDFKLLQLSWVFDLNFTTSFRMLQQRQYIDRLAAALPQNDRVHDAIAVLKDFVSEKLANE